MKKMLYCVVVLFVAGGAVCNNQKPAGKSDSIKPEALSYANDIKPFFATHCVECHSGPKAKGGFNFDGYAALMKGGNKGPAIVPGDPDGSWAVRVLTGQGKRMPPQRYKNQPKPEDVEMLKAWISAGAKDDGGKND